MRGETVCPLRAVSRRSHRAKIFRIDPIVLYRILFSGYKIEMCNDAIHQKAFNDRDFPAIRCARVIRIVAVVIPA